jgi:ribosomal protein S18 acetylase RimI-like enzyme
MSMIPAGLTFKVMEADETVDVCRFVNSVFDGSVAPLYTEKGRRNFRDYADSAAMSLRVSSNHFVLLAEENDRIAGMIEIRDHSHVSLLFVDPHQQDRGLGGELLSRSLKICRSADPGLGEITVNSSPNAVEIYERMGFETTGNEQDINGVRSTPMRRSL